jgi:hypothetical protein
MTDGISTFTKKKYSKREAALQILSSFTHISDDGATIQPSGWTAELNMSREEYEMWIDTLAGAGWPQCKGELRNSAGSCCLGVLEELRSNYFLKEELVDMVVPSGNEELDIDNLLTVAEGMGISTDANGLPVDLASFDDNTASTFVGVLANLNDSADFTFFDIACTLQMLLEAGYVEFAYE